MLGHIKSSQLWSWAAYGKHPSARDYINVGQDSPIAKGFSGWVDSGYEKLGGRKNSAHDQVAWRFWARGAEKEHIVCGLVKDSSDMVGRHYPLLIIGTGALKDWENRWDLMPIVCEKPWGQLEYASARMVQDIHILEKEIQSIRPPCPEWTEHETSRKKLVDSLTGIGHGRNDLDDMKNRAAGLSGREEAYISLDNKIFQDRFALINCWHMFLKSGSKGAPNTVFIGGTFERSYMVIFNRPIKTDDFIDIWSLDSAGAREDGSLVNR
ncbi:MAG: type VI secretion system-associated protein TagF [Nitrospirota bacterium]